MRRRDSVLALLALLGLVILCPVEAQVLAAPQLMSFSGRLTRPDGTLVPDGNYSLRFSFHTAASGGTEKWNQTFANVPVKNGTFAVLLNTSAGAADKFNADLWLEIKIGADVPLTPRQQITSVAYAQKANGVKDGGISANSLADLAVTPLKLANDPASLARVSGGVLSSNGTSAFLNDRLLTFRGVGDSNHGLGYFGSYGGNALDGPALFGFNGGALGYQNTRVLTWTNQGRVGIGTATPGMKLDVNGTETVGLRYRRTDARDARIQVGDPTKSWSLASGWATAGDFSIIEEGTSGNRLYIQQTTGNVGIGTSTPAARLDVNGTAQMTGFKLSTGAGAGKALTSDASGAGTWQTVTSLLGANSITDSMIQSVDWSKIANAPSSSGWGLTGNAGTNPAIHFLGTTDDQPLVFKANNQRALQMQYVLHNTTGYEGNNLLGGYWLNSATDGVTGATIFGGLQLGVNKYPNKVTDHGGTVSGGVNNRAGNDNATLNDAVYATVGGGTGNIASSHYSVVGGGESNAANGYWATVGGGWKNTVSNWYATVGGGSTNLASELRATVGGGNHNTASGDSATIAGGSTNSASYLYATVGGGWKNIASNHAATVPGGAENTASGFTSFAAGKRAKANHDGAFVWGDNTDADIASTAANQFLIRAGGGVGINTNNPAGFALNVNGSLRCVGFTNASDGRWKTNVADLANPLETILNLRGVSYEWRRDAPGMNFPEGPQIGFIAQEVEKTLPELVTTDASGYKSVAYANVVPILVEAVKTQHKQIEALKAKNARIGKVEAENAELKARLEALEAAVLRLTAQPK